MSIGLLGEGGGQDSLIKFVHFQKEVLSTNYLGWNVQVDDLMKLSLKSSKRLYNMEDLIVVVAGPRPTPVIGCP